MDPSALRGVFIGTQSLLVRCAERFREHGHDLRAIVSTDPGVQRWATERGILSLDPDGELAARLPQEPFDYLFSVAHLSAIPAKILALPRRAAINFHDGPLPEYAGLNVTSWALLNRERDHGVTWHLMTERLDAGPILVERRFPISDGETALTLNAKCYEAALDSFDELVTGLSRGDLAPRPQDLRRRRYCAKHMRPPCAGSVECCRPAADIDAFVRGLDFGPYANPLTTAKIWIGTHAVVVRRVETLASRSRCEAGTVTGIDSSGVTVATGTEEVRLSGFTTLLGKPLATHDLEETYGLRRGGSLAGPSGDRARALTDLHARICRHEEFWTSRLTRLEDVDVPFARRREPRGPDGPCVAKQLATPQSFLDRFASAPGDVLLGAMAAYLSRIVGKAEFDVRFRHPGLEQITAEMGLFSPLVPLRVRVDPRDEFGVFAGRFLEELRSVRGHASYDLDLALRQPALAESLRRWHDESPAVVFERVPSLPGSWPSRSDAAWSVIVPDDAHAIVWLHREDVLDAATISRMEGQFRAFLADLLEARGGIQDLRILPPEEEAWVLARSAGPDVPHDRGRCVHELFEAQVRRTPDAEAVVFRDEVLTYAGLNARANQVAQTLIGRRIGPGALVGVLMDRSPAMIAAMMGILKAGAAYVPLDPAYPNDRLAYIAKDADVAAVLCDERHAVLRQGASFPLIASGDLAPEPVAVADPVTAVRPHDLAYVIYTSGSTGRPKGVMVEHRNVVSFFAGMDERLGGDVGTWLAVTSISFDISVLEIFWTLARGFKIVLHGGDEAGAGLATSAPVRSRAGDPVAFSLFYFASDEAEKRGGKYDLILEGSKFADAHEFEAVWTPERHFHEFGGLYPNPSVMSAAIAAVTRRVKIRAGSCVLPLHSPLRIAEEWALVDNLSNGRVGISFASGWHPDDFVLAPDAYRSRHQDFYRGIEVVRALWRGERRAFRGPGGEVEVQALPRPVQPELPCWVTAAGNPETFRQAGAIGANLLTHLLGQSVEEVAGKLEIYRRARREAGHPGRGRVTLMLHTFVAHDEDFVRSLVHGPLKEYLRSATNLLVPHASSFPAFRRAGREGIDRMFQELSPDDMDALLEHAFERYYESSGLFGTPERCLGMVDALRRIGVDEIACLVDFGVPSDVVLAHLPYLDELRQRASAAPQDHRGGDDHGLPVLLARRAVTHLQCTPSLAAILTRNDEARTGLRRLGNLMVGGEALPGELAARLRDLAPGRMLNMYGPTETTIWSATHDVTEASGNIPIGRPIANTQIYVVDGSLRLVPRGVAGELVIGGDGVARGYLNRPEITAERFVADPFRPGGRLYRTGDLGRWREDGVLEFLGRMDDQVKIRGHRVELGEIQAVLERHPAVRAAVVAAREDAPGEKWLVGYVIPERGRAPNAQELRDHLGRELPEFMVPAAFVMLEAFPLTPNKKVDVRSLPAPQASRPELGGAYVAPRTANEAILAGFFQEALGIERVGIHDDFIQLGGDSLSAVEIFSKIQEAFSVEFPLVVLFRTPTVAGLAEEIERALGPGVGHRESARAEISP